MSTDISKWLQDIVDIKGVTGVFVVSNRGQIVAHAGVKIETGKIGRIADRILRIEGAFRRKGQSLKEIDIIASNYRIIGMMREYFTIFTLCNSTDALPLIRITLNVTIAHLLEDKKFNKFITKSGTSKTQIINRAVFNKDETKLISKLQR